LLRSSTSLAFSFFLVSGSVWLGVLTVVAMGKRNKGYAAVYVLSRQKGVAGGGP
jgi:hypothetical protein